MQIGQSRTKRTQSVMMIRHADHHLLMTAMVAVTHQAAVVVIMMEEKTVAEEEVKGATTLMRNGRSTVAESDSESGHRAGHVPPQGDDVERNVDASLLVNVGETPACRKIDIRHTANTDSELKSTSTTARHVAMCSCVDLKTSLITTIGMKLINLHISKLLYLVQRNI